MKYANYLGALFSILIITTCFVPWVYIASIDVAITGLSAPGTNFGKPGLINIFMCAVALVLFLVNAIWAKRLNIFIVTFNLAWAFRNYLILTFCEMGDCPEKRWGLYALVILSVTMLVLALLPKVKLKSQA